MYYIRGHIIVRRGSNHCSEEVSCLLPCLSLSWNTEAARIKMLLCALWGRSDLDPVYFVLLTLASVDLAKYGMALFLTVHTSGTAICLLEFVANFLYIHIYAMYPWKTCPIIVERGSTSIHVFCVCYFLLIVLIDVVPAPEWVKLPLRKNFKPNLACLRILPTLSQEIN